MSYIGCRTCETPVHTKELFMAQGAGDFLYFFCSAKCRDGYVADFVESLSAEGKEKHTQEEHDATKGPAT